MSQLRTKSSPEIILSPEEKRLYQQLFQIAGDGKKDYIEGKDAANFLKKSNLPPNILGEIWSLADYENRGFLNKQTFSIAVKLIALVQNGQNLDTNLLKTKVPLPHFEGVYTDSWDVTPEEKAKYDELFDKIDEMKLGFLTGDQAAQFFMKSKLNNATLGMIWDLSDIDKTGRFDNNKFAVAMHLIKNTLKGLPLPTNLPASLIPLQMRQAAASRFFDLKRTSTLGHVSKANIGSTSPPISHSSYSSESIFDLNDHMDSQNVFASDNITKEQPEIDLLGDTDINTKIAIESGEIKKFETQIESFGKSSTELKIRKNNLETTLANLITKKQEIQNLCLQTRSLYEAERKTFEEIQVKLQLENENVERAREELAQAERALASTKLEKEQMKANIQKDKDEIIELKRKLRIVEEETVSAKAEIEKLQKDGRQQKNLLDINRKQLMTVESEREKSLETLKSLEKSNTSPLDVIDALAPASPSLSASSTSSTVPQNVNSSSDVFQSMFITEQEKIPTTDFFNEQNTTSSTTTVKSNSSVSEFNPFNDLNNNNNNDNNNNNINNDLKNTTTSDKTAFDSAFSIPEATTNDKKDEDDQLLTETFNSEKFPSLEELEASTNLSFGNDFNNSISSSSDKKENKTASIENFFADLKEEIQSEKSNTTEINSSLSDEKIEDKIDSAFKNGPPSSSSTTTTTTKDANFSDDIGFNFTDLTDAKVMEKIPVGFDDNFDFDDKFDPKSVSFKSNINGSNNNNDKNNDNINKNDNANNNNNNILSSSSNNDDGKTTTNPKPDIFSSDNDFSFFDPLSSSNDNQSMKPTSTILDAAFGGTFEAEKTENNNYEFEDDFFQGNGAKKSSNSNLKFPVDNDDDDIEDVKTLRDMGFPRESAVKALEDNDYDINKAIHALAS